MFDPQMISEAMVDRVRQRRIWIGIFVPWVLWGGLVSGMSVTASAHPRTSAAVEAWSARIAGSPEEPLLYVERARQWRLLGSHDRAARDLRRAEGLAPDIAATALEWALLERDRGRHDRAVWWASRAATLDPGWWRPRRLRGELSLERGENSQASLDLVWVAMRRGEPDDVALAARALERERRGSAAARLLEEAAATRRAPTLALMAADIHARRGDFQASLMAIGLAEALGLDPFTAAVRVAEALLDDGAYADVSVQQRERAPALERLSARRMTPHRQALHHRLAALVAEASALDSRAASEQRALACLDIDAPHDRSSTFLTPVTPPTSGDARILSSE